jgi:hypothetical protein
MNDNDKNLIEKYIDGELKGEALTLFEKRLKTDKSLAKEYKQRIRVAKLWVDADNYRTTKAEISNVLHKSEMNFFRSNRYLIFSIAASIIILVGVYFLMVHDNDTISNEFANVNDSINNKDNTIIFQYDEPDKLAAIDSVSSNIQLLFPVNGDTFNTSQPITFKWKSDLNQNDTLFVSNESSGKILLKLRIRLSDTTYTIKYPQFTVGKYLWYISNNTNHQEFIVIEK